MSSQILETYDDSLTTYLLTSASNVQDVTPRAVQRGVHLDGGHREDAGLGMALGGNGFESGCRGPRGGDSGDRRVPGDLCEIAGGNLPCFPQWLQWNGNNRACGDIRLDTGTYSPTDIDIAMPAPGFPWRVGRAYNARQELSGSHHDSNGYQGRNWFQLSQPEIKFYDHATDNAKDVVYLIYGADRYIEFKRESSTSNQFKAKNGAAGVMDFAVASVSEPEKYTYTDQHGNKIVFFGFSANAGAAKGQLWKMTDPNGNVAYVGDATTASTAITNGYDTGGRITLAFDTAGRRYTYAYSTLDSVVRLTQVKVEVNDGGWVEVNKVDYAYYESGDTTYGEAGNLKLVTITTPLTDSSKSIIRKKYYRYWKSGDGGGTSYQVKLVVDFEGTRNYDWTQNAAFDDDFLTAGHNALIDYAAAYFEYSSRQISLATFNGQRACAGIATGEGTYEFTYETNGSHPGAAGYDTAWKSRTIVELPDTRYLTQYFDEVGQPLGKVHTKLAPSQTSGQKTWATQVIRDSRGCITAIHSPANVTAYTHSTGAFTLSSSVGLVTTFTRQSSGDLTGFLTDVKHKTGNSLTAYLDLTLTYATASKTITDSTVVRPFIASRRIYEDEITSGTTNSHLTTLTFDSFHTGDGVLMPETVTTTYPAVTTGKNGSGTANTSKQHFNKDGTLGFTKSPDDRIDYMEYTGGQLTKRIIDADTSKTGAGEDFNGVTIPTGFSTVGAGALHRKTTFAYDKQARLDVTNAASAGGLVKKQNYSRLASRLQVTLAYNHFDEAATPDKFYGPVQYSVANHAGRTVYNVIVELTGNESTTAINSHVDTNDSDVIDAVDALGTAHILRKAVFNKTGTRVDEERQYHSKPPAPGVGGSTPRRPSSSGTTKPDCRAWADHPISTT